MLEIIHTLLDHTYHQRQSDARLGGSYKLLHYFIHFDTLYISVYGLDVVSR